MKLKLFKINIIFISGLAITSHAMDKKYTLPKAQAINQCLTSKGLHYFDEKTKISKNLGGQTLTMNQISQATNQHMNSFCAYIQRPSTCAAMNLHKDQIQSCLITKK